MVLQRNTSFWANLLNSYWPKHFHRMYLYIINKNRLKWRPYPFFTHLQSWEISAKKFLTFQRKLSRRIVIWPALTTHQQSYCWGQIALLNIHIQLQLLITDKSNSFRPTKISCYYTVAENIVLTRTVRNAKNIVTIRVPSPENIHPKPHCCNNRFKLKDREKMLPTWYMPIHPSPHQEGEKRSRDA